MSVFRERLQVHPALCREGDASRCGVTTALRSLGGRNCSAPLQSWRTWLASVGSGEGEGCAHGGDTAGALVGPVWKSHVGRFGDQQRDRRDWSCVKAGRLDPWSQLCHPPAVCPEWGVVSSPQTWRSRALDPVIARALYSVRSRRRSPSSGSHGLCSPASGPPSMQPSAQGGQSV